MGARRSGAAWSDRGADCWAILVEPVRPAPVFEMSQRLQTTDLAFGIGFAAVYAIAAKLGLMLAYVHPNATAVWPPTGMALAAVLLIGTHIWPSILVGAFIANVATAGTIWTALGIASGNTVEAVLGGLLVKRLPAAGTRSIGLRTP